MKGFIYVYGKSGTGGGGVGGLGYKFPSLSRVRMRAYARTLRVKKKFYSTEYYITYNTESLGS